MDDSWWWLGRWAVAVNGGRRTAVTGAVDGGRWLVAVAVAVDDGVGDGRGGGGGGDGGGGD